MRWGIGLVLGSVLVAVAVRVAPGLAGPQHEGRPVAEVMGWQGHAWLERDNREAEENPAKLMALLKLKPGQSVLDLGCGSGYYARRMAREVGPKGTVYCVDLQPEMLTIAEQHAKEAGLTNLRFVQGAVDRIPLPDASIDLALLVDVYHEFSKPKEMLTDLGRVLGPKGQAAIAEFRLEGSSAAHIKTDHRMAADQVKLEWKKAGFTLKRFETKLPTQHLLFFEVAESAAEGKSVR
ncbi:MAG: methyltransferase domain-containing protein [Myxococcota bacterium]